MTPKTYHLRSFRDVFELPTTKHVETCMKELTALMLQARVGNDSLADHAKRQGVDVPRDLCFEFPEVVEWIDDDKGEVEASFMQEDGKAVFTIVSKPGKNT